MSGRDDLGEFADLLPAGSQAPTAPGDPGAGLGEFASLLPASRAAAPAPPADAPWWQQIMDAAQAGFGHRMNVEGQRTAMGVEHPMEAAALQAAPFGALIPYGLLPGHDRGPAETAAAAATAAQDARDQKAGVGEGFLPSLAYGLGESPEAMMFPELRALKAGGVMRAGANAALNGAAQGLYGAGVNDRDATQGAAFGAAGGLGGKMLGAIGGKVWNAARGAWEDATLQASDRAARSLGVVPTVGDLAPEGAFRKLEDIAKFVPGSGAPAAAKVQAQHLAEHVQALQDESAAPIAHLLGSKTPEQIVADDARNQLAQREAQARELFAAVPGDTVVEPTRFLPALRALMREHSDLFNQVDAPASIKAKVAMMLDPEQAAAAALTDTDRAAMGFVGKLGKASPEERAHLLEQISPGIGDRMANAPPPVLTASEAHWLQSELGSAGRALDRQAATGGRTGSAAHFVNDAHHALLDDMSATEGVSEPFKAARAYFRQYVLPYRSDPTLRSLVEPNASGERLFNKFGADDVAKAHTVMGALGPEGQAALRYGFIARAGNRGVNEGLSSGLSTAKLAKGYDIGDQIGQNRQLAEIFTPEQQTRISAIRDAALLSRRLAEWSHNPHTGAQNLPFNLAKGAMGLATGAGAVTGGPAGALVGATAPVASAALTTFLSRNPAFKNLYFGSARTRADPILQALAAQAGAANAQENAPSIMDYLGAGR